MKTYKYPEEKQWPALTARPELKKDDLRATIAEIFAEVKSRRDAALIEFTNKFDGINLETLEIDLKKIDESSIKISEKLKNAIQLAKQNIENFHARQLETTQKVETMEGVTCWRESRGIEKVGLYIPGGSAPLFSTILMLAVPAKIAGCREVVLCTPTGKDGKVPAAVLYTAKICGIKKICTVGGAQAIAAMSIGTESVPKVYKIFGPGNQYVTAAKRYASEFGTAIDMPAGPSEVLVIADGQADPEFCAADLLSQAEHGADSQVIFLATDEAIFENTLAEIEKQTPLLPRAETARRALENSRFIILKSLSECNKFSNLYAPEHLILAVDKPEVLIPEIINAGSVFLGNYSCESAGDYASGTNHTLPTNGYARSYSGVSVDSFVKKITFQQITPAGLQNIGPAIEEMAEAEGLQAHKNAVTLRLKKPNA